MAFQKSSERDLMKELGLTGEEILPSSSEEEEEVSISEQSMKQSDELLELKKSLKETQYKLRVAQSNLSQAEHGKERRLKILRKTHQSALSLKQVLIKELQDMIQEKNEYIAQLEDKLAGKNVEIKVKTPQDSDLKKLIEQFSRLSKEHIDLQSQHEKVLEVLKEERARLTLDDIPMKGVWKSSASVKPAMMQNIKELQNKLAVLEKEHEEFLLLQSSNQKLCNKNRELESKFCRAEEEISALKSKQKKDRELESKLSRAEEEISILKNKVCERCKLLAIEISSLEKHLDHDKLELKQLKQEKGLFTMMLQESSEKISQMTKDIDILKSRVHNQENENEQLFDELENLQYKKSRGKNGHLHRTISEISMCVSELSSDIKSATNSMDHLNTYMKQEYSQVSKQVRELMLGMYKKTSLSTKKYLLEMKRRKDLHNQLMELRGNIRVFCRVRPLISEDGGGSEAAVVVDPDKEDDSVVRVYSRGSWKRFEVDKVFGQSSTQDEIFDEVKSLVTSCLDGFNVCIFAYGQTGSGKTYTMEGSVKNPGVNQKTLYELFDRIKCSETDWNYSILVSMIEIYNESIHDLLSSDHYIKLDLKLNSDGLYIPGLTQVSVSNVDEVNEVFSIGHQNRITASTKMNISSSRSHALLCISVMGHNVINGIQTFGKLNLIDLAGSERLHKSGSDGVRLQEAKHINKSLSSLADVIHSLRVKSRHVPYRNSKLTFLLQDSLGGASKTLMIVQLSPTEKNSSETVCSLNFAQRVRAVELGQSEKKVVSDN